MKGFSVENELTWYVEHPRTLRFAVLALMTVTLLVMAVDYFRGAYVSLPQDAVAFMFVWLIAAITTLAVLPQFSFVLGFLVSLLCMLVAWRISALHDVTVVFYVLLVAFLIYLLMFARIVWRSINHEDPKLKLDRTDWHETLIRIYIGFDLVPHFTEKLFAGPGPRDADIKSFTELGVVDPAFFVTLGGFCELGIAIGIGLGILTRLAAVCSALYFLIATILGHHFFMGFIWVSPGGGWEYPLLMIVLLISFQLDGAGPFSVDNVILRRVKPPRWLRAVMVPTRD
ncbi:MAG: DoxX family protein [Pseudomonadota bacterium]